MTRCHPVARPGLCGALAVALVAIAACSPRPGSTAGQSAPSTAAASPAAPASDSPPPSDWAGSAGWLPDWADASIVPPEIANRRPLPFCGLEKAPVPGPGEFIDRAVRLCFWTAHQAGTEAEFASVQRTIEGAPIATIYRLLADGKVEVLTDFTQDPFGGNAWQAMTCAQLVEGEGDALIGVAGCGESRTLP